MTNQKILKVLTQFLTRLTTRKAENMNRGKLLLIGGLNFNLGNAVKYVSRAGRKGDKIEDLRKAIQYIEFEI